MKIKRYFAADMRQAIRMVREEQGPDAVILSNRRVDGGVEIVAAIDYDEALVHKMANGEGARAKAAAATPRPAAAAPDAGSTQRTQRFQPLSSAAPRAPSAPPSKIVWSQDPALVSMRDEIKTLRGMLESQLTGFAWREEAMRHPARAKLLERLLQLGLAPGLCRGVADQVPYQGGNGHHWRHALGLLARRVGGRGGE